MAKPTSRAEQELQLWRTWKSNPTPETLEPLLDSLENLVYRKVAEYRNAPVPPSAIQGFAQAQVIKAINTYSPNKNATLGTWVTTHLKKVQGMASEYQNVGRIPVHRVSQIGRYQAAKAELTQKYGHPPSAQQLVDHLSDLYPGHWSLAEVGRMEAEDRKDYIASINPEPDLLQEEYDYRDREILRYIYQELTPDEQLVFEYTLGVHGKPELPAGQIADVMGISKPKVSRLRKKILAKIDARRDEY